ncbi:hypothetical protein Psfp_02353 [Pelotomaculum sp. FP]|uniref:HNH endonuclease family protein n=1 Tax=Pelotomaculum sp. FP TaxID=261474 RepID=UPI00106490C4|nr:DUF262 domain-containing protein [Pelotomaculum sp. FP]TEB15177.1 hypothetical protein Psfp_02353 [Pelotomaculum sp. FP]
MPVKKKTTVNLDALITREDFEASDETMNTASKISTLSVNDLKEGSGLFLASVRKPDFQRETADWGIDKVVRFITSFVNGEFIPAVILWRSQAGLIFVIDGSHRLSSLIAWVNDDYGDGQFSLDVFDGDVPEEQRIIAKKARERINSQIGPYLDYYKALTAKHPDPEIIVKARNLASRALQIQWIDGDVKTAERSFFNINQQAAPIDPTELKLLQKRKTPNCIAARSIVKAGKGHKYWHNFSKENQEAIESISETIHDLLFEPGIVRPIKTLDLPICDKSNNFLTLVYDYIRFINVGDSEKNDEDGTKTIECLKKAERIARLFSSTSPGSYGLHPILYCYSNRGNFRPSSFYGAIEFVKTITDKPPKLKLFIKNRKAFETFIFENDAIIKKMIDTIRRGLQSAKHISEYYFTVLELLDQGMSNVDVINALVKNDKYKKVVTNIPNSDLEITSPVFSSSSKSEVFIREAVKNAPKCSICGGILHNRSITVDHILRKREGGLGIADNGQLAHPYCNTGVKN